MNCLFPFVGFETSSGVEKALVYRSYSEGEPRFTCIVEGGKSHYANQDYSCLGTKGPSYSESIRPHGEHLSIAHCCPVRYLSSYHFQLFNQ